LQQQAEYRSESCHSAEEALPEQQAKQICAKEPGSKPTEQSAAAEKPGTG
jgi:hypothetical protein